jgi:hypothetical protein
MGATSSIDESGKQVVKQLWFEGWSASMISDKLTDKYPDVTRNVVIGIVMRARENGDEAAKPRITKITDMSRRIERDMDTAPRTFPIPAPRPKKPTLIGTPEPDFLGPENDFPPLGCCRYMHDDPQRGNFKMCGHPTRGTGDPWCQWHKDNTIYPSKAA